VSAAESAAKLYALPPSLISRADLSRLMRELEALEVIVESQKIQDTAGARRLPALSLVLRDITELNDVDLTDDKQRQELNAQLKRLKQASPIVHLIFPAAVDAESLEMLVAWLRQNAHPQALVRVGLQPSLVGGVYIRTTNKVFDFSLKGLLGGRHDIISKELGSLLA